WTMWRVARPTGFEPATCSFGGCHSIHLSYGRDVLILQEVPFTRHFGGRQAGSGEWGWLFSQPCSHPPAGFSPGQAVSISLAPPTTPVTLAQAREFPDA